MEPRWGEGQSVLRRYREKRQVLMWVGWSVGADEVPFWVQEKGHFLWTMREEVVGEKMEGQ